MKNKSASLLPKLFFITIIVMAGSVVYLRYEGKKTYGKEKEYQKIYENGKDLYEKKEYDQAVTQFNKLLNLNSKNFSYGAEDYILKVYRKQGKLQQFVEFLKSRIGKGSDSAFKDATRLSILAKVYLEELKDKNEAKKYYLKIVSQQPSPESYLALARIDDEQGDLAEAVKYAEEAAKWLRVSGYSYSISSAEGLTILGNLYFKANRLQDAQKTFEEVLSLDPKNVSAQESLMKLAKTTSALGAPSKS